MSRKKTKEQFIAEAKNVHGDKYDYSKVIYIDANTKVTIICPIHGMFFQRPSDHLRGIGCKKCACDNRGKESRMSFSEFLRSARMVHGNKYEYNEKSFIGSHFDIAITCPVHGTFPQKAEKHLSGQGCPKCALVERHKKVYGKGVNDLEINTKKDISYRIWHNMLSRTVNELNKSKMPAYKDATVCDEWLIYSNFKKWFDNPNNGYIEGYELDKDILSKGNKVYSPDTCCFIPHEINSLIRRWERRKGEYPQGVSKNNKNSYKVTVGVRGTRIYVGTFNTVEDASNAYSRAKEAIIKSIAKEYYDEGLLTEKTYNGLISFKVCN